VIFEDRKFADIGNTVALQYSSGVYGIASWSHITNAHPVPGPSVITGLASVGLSLGRGLLLLAEMSTEGSLASGSYTNDAVRMARKHREFVIGFIAQRRMEGIGATPSLQPDDEDFIILTPGVSLDTIGDAMGQQYRTPKQVVLEDGCDVIIVGRGIYGNGTGDGLDVAYVKMQAQKYRAEGWNAYLRRIGPESTRRQHGHITRKDRGINVDLATDIAANYTWTPPLATPQNDDSLEGPEGITDEDFEKAIAELDQHSAAEGTLDREIEGHEIDAAKE